MSAATFRADVDAKAERDAAALRDRMDQGPAWPLTDRLTMCCAMRKFGGDFAVQFSRALACADETNARRLLAAFPDLVAKYGPGSAMFNDVRGIK